jgi:hypothetical protein
VWCRHRRVPNQSRPYRPGVPGETRTPDLQARSPALCPLRYRDSGRSLPGEVTKRAFLALNSMSYDELSDEELDEILARVWPAIRDQVWGMSDGTGGRTWCWRHPYLVTARRLPASLLGYDFSPSRADP